MPNKIMDTKQYPSSENSEITMIQDNNTTDQYNFTNSLTGAQSHSCYSFCPRCGVDVAQFSHDDNCPLAGP
ncbi:hypothetical protein BDF21DRAFT_408054 [Thamnidium elegans]|nr:hypothetical protein BDF21DRAFT_408054 [Thamnidium elegans]